MKIFITYPPLDNEKGYPTLGQNRQFQYFKEPTYIYPIVPAQAATLLKQAGHEVIGCNPNNIGGYPSAQIMLQSVLSRKLAQYKPDLEWAWDNLDYNYTIPKLHPASKVIEKGYFCNKNFHQVPNSPFFHICNRYFSDGNTGGIY